MTPHNGTTQGGVYPPHSNKKSRKRYGGPITAQNLEQNKFQISAKHKRALKFVLMIGVVSFFADFTYEGARSIAGPFLLMLGASGAVVSIAAGFGELLGYSLRFFSGHLSERTGEFWPITIIGYMVQMSAVPLLAFAGNWQIAVGLILQERVGKAIRNPPRDVMLSHAAKEMGMGWGFGVHEALDQFGALFGPLLVALILARRGDYRLAFGTLLAPL
ncbi:MAG TPA: MFS transporter [Terriglobia bacterium]|nr:MFS transporter [Terriglobia bacterium]